MGPELARVALGTALATLSRARGLRRLPTGTSTLRRLPRIRRSHTRVGVFRTLAPLALVATATAAATSALLLATISSPLLLVVSSASTAALLCIVRVASTTTVLGAVSITLLATATFSTTRAMPLRNLRASSLRRFGGFGRLGPLCAPLGGLGALVFLLAQLTGQTLVAVGWELSKLDVVNIANDGRINHGIEEAGSGTADVLRLSTEGEGTCNDGHGNDDIGR
mmetsp:Transcript_4083/g.11606  ORF Transcript_4083/g.11606 Transcript_4083/m.11606 type:complete len:224 (+) Transcript_4083:1710-2381(+)